MIRREAIVSRIVVTEASWFKLSPWSRFYRLVTDSRSPQLQPVERTPSGWAIDGGRAKPPIPSVPVPVPTWDSESKRPAISLDF